MAFTRAKRTKVPLKIAMTGATGSGKTFSALLLAFGLGSKVAVVDTENESASLYEHLGEFDVNNIYAPFTVKKYTDAIREAEKMGYEVLVIDSGSHVWNASGGLLQQKEAKDAAGGNSFTNWATVSKQYEEFKSVILESRMHIIFCMRSKMEHVQEKDDRTGKTVVKKLGLAPVMRDGIEYEFTILFDIQSDHTAIATKDRTGVFDGWLSPISEKHGKALTEWQAGAKEATVEMATADQIEKLAKAYAGIGQEWKAPASMTLAQCKTEIVAVKDIKTQQDQAAQTEEAA
jgi:hypothetical protein